MDKNALMKYALWARKELESQIGLSLNRLGFYKTGIKGANIVGDYTIIEGTQETFPKRVYTLRNQILERHIKENGFDETVEEFAYTWFNRIIALRFMEVHDYFSHGFRVLTSRDGSYEPEILRNVDFVIDDLKLKADVVRSLKEQGKEEELYRYILFSQCNVLSDVLPMLFSTQEAYMELLLPGNLLSQDSVIRHITDIPEEDFQNDVEVIGWLYQFYNSVKKDEVFASKKTITKDTLPAVTQLFTPDWIVRYMAQNSVGRIWLEAHPNSSLHQQMKYYVDDAPQDSETEKKLEEIKYKNLKLEELKIIEPCCGSGHILVYVFDLLFEMYKEEGYLTKDIPSKILSNNLYGLDVDRRAAQLSQFALVMKARSIDNRFFNKDRYVRPHVYELLDSKIFSRFDMKQCMRDFGFTAKEKEVTQYLIDTFQDGKTIGSLLKVEPNYYLEVAEDLKKLNNEYIANLLQRDFQENGIPRIIELCNLAHTLSSKYDVVITNPPYIGISTMETSVKSYAARHYPSSKTDMCTMFMESTLVAKNGFLSMINMHSWMFLDSYTEFRKWILSHFLIESLLHLGIKAFEDIGNDIVQTCSFIFRNCVPITDYRAPFYRLVDIKDFQKKQTEFFNSKHLFYAKPKKFLSVPGYLLTPYFAGDKFLDNFSTGTYITEISDFTGSQNITGNNGKYLRFFWEVDYNKINQEYWVPYAKGGNYRKYYGDLNLVVDWRPEARKFYKENKTSNLLDPDYWFKQGITYSAVTSRGTGFRYLPAGCIFDKGGPSIIMKSHLYETLALLNSKVADYYFKIFNPSINLQVKDIKSFPLIFDNSDLLERLAKENVAIAKSDYDSNEFSMNYISPFIGHQHQLLKDVFQNIVHEENNALQKITKNEEEINTLVNRSYGMTLPLVFEPRDFPVEIKNFQSLSKELISYSIGCIMGRYSLDLSGIAFAGGKWDASKYHSFIPNSDGILPIDKETTMGDVVETEKEFFSAAFGREVLEKNLRFIADYLDSKNASAIDVLRNYLVHDFYEDHLKTFGKRPIYWMLCSGKHKAFQCLFYLHRYTPNTLALINTKYFLPRTAQYKAEYDRLETQIALEGLEPTAKIKLEKRLEEVKACQEELLEYGQVLDHLANQYIDLNLDDGVKVNYEKFQHVSVEMDGRTITKDLLLPIK